MFQKYFLEVIFCKLYHSQQLIENMILQQSFEKKILMSSKRFDNLIAITLI